MVLLFSTFFFAGLAHAFKAFQPNCTIPAEHVTWVSSPQVRGTMGILFSCFSVLLLCTWAIQHLSVPPHIEPKEHSWNRRFVRNAHYSAFLDDTRFNFTKLKWMAMSLLAPEYIFAKALAELLAAHDSRRDFKEKDWTTTHGYYANMRGFVLRFDVAAVPTSLEPGKPDKLGRSLFKPCENGDSPYFPQDAERAEAEELKHCHKICGIPCRNRPRDNIGDGDKPLTDPWLGPQAPASAEACKDEPQRLRVDVQRQPRTTTVEMTNLTTDPTGSTHHPSEDFHMLTASTLVNNQGFSHTNTPLSPVNRHGFPMNTTPTNLVNGYDFPVASNTAATTLGDDRDSWRPSTTKDYLEEDRLLKTPAKSIAEKKNRLGPHKKWKATWALSSMQMLYAYREGIIPLPDVTVEELNDRSKGDALVKGLAVLHITWLVISTIARGVQKLAISQLEITVLAFSACALLTYFLLWYKPQDVKVPTYIDISSTLTREQIIQLAARSPVSTLMVHQYWLHGVVIRAMADNVFPWSPGIKFKLPYVMKDHIFLSPILVGIAGGGVIFGGVHFAAWNLAFPTPIETLLWRISCTYLVMYPLLGTLIYCVVQDVTRKGGVEDGKVNKMLRPLGRVTVPVYLLARVFLLVEVFRCLAYPPPSAFVDVGWPSVIPHIS